MSTAERARIYADTRRLVASRDHVKIDVVPFPEMKGLRPKDESSLARVYEMDPLDIAEVCVASGYNPLVLVEANENYPEPGMAKGGMTGQESELLLRSNYALCMADGIYPLKRRTYTFASKIYVVKNSKYQQMSRIYTIPVLGATVIRSPTVHVRQENGQGVEYYASTSEENLMRETIYGAFDFAVRKGYDTLIAPALGCEKGHPVDAVIKFYNDAMSYFDIKYVFFGVRCYRDDHTRTPLFLSFHRDIHRKYIFDPEPVVPAVDDELVNEADLVNEAAPVPESEDNITPEPEPAPDPEPAPKPKKNSKPKAKAKPKLKKPADA